jgi:predicted TIM-barrel fold metal-dependent hydrolase
MSLAWQKRLNIGEGQLGTGQFAVWRLPSGVFFNPHGGIRTDAIPPSGGFGGSDPKFMAKQLFEEHEIDFSVCTVNQSLFAGALTNPALATTVMRAFNDYFINEWLTVDKRFLGSIHVAPQDPVGAAKEIRRLAGHPKMVQVFIPTYSIRFGNSYYDPIWDAAQECGLPVAWHPGSENIGGNGGHTAGGWPTTYVESYSTGTPHVAQAELTSVITEGTFEKFPKARLVLIEGGVAWIVGLLWRLRRAWIANRDEIPWVTRPPEEYVKDHIRISTQPLEEPSGDVRDLYTVLNTVHADEFLMYASDYPHWDFDNPKAALRAFPAEWQRKIMYENPMSFYPKLAEIMSKA